MRRFLVVVLVLLPLIAFGAEKSLKGAPFPEPPEGSSMAKAKSEANSDCKYFMSAETVSGVTCRDKCFANEQEANKVKIMEGEHKDMQVCLKCIKKGVKDSKGRAVLTGKVPCSKKN